MRDTLQIYIIAGEASGDFIGSELIASLRKKLGSQMNVMGIGGERMQRQGLSSLFPMQELSLMGFAEILPHIFSLKQRIRQTVLDILQRNPDIVITIDSPGFTFRVVEALREKRFQRPIVHYVAPTVWAYKEKRAAKTASLFDKLLTLLPFEPPYFEKEGLDAQYVGHPFAWDWREKGDEAGFRERHGITDDKLILGMMPGSRINEVLRHLPIYRKTVEALQKQYPSLVVIMPLRQAMADEVRMQVQDWPVPVYVVVGDNEKKDAFAACDAAIAKSGTVALEVALAGIPSITAYRANPISVWIIRRLIKVSHVNLINIIAGEPVVPEFIQEHCTPENLTAALTELLSNEAVRNQQLLRCAQAITQLGQQDSASPSEKAADAIISVCETYQNEQRTYAA